MIEALHGFLGQPSDWDQFKYNAHDITEIESPSEINLNIWGSLFNNKMRAKKKSILLGYSLGGRLALHALVHSPKQWRGAVIISAHTGLKCKTEKKKRLDDDAVWAKRFLQEPWEQVLAAWNAQPIFQGSKNLSKREKFHSPQILADMLMNWSLGHQEDLSENIKNLDLPILWVAGKQDIVYTDLAKKLQFKHRESEVWIAEGAGHRVPWDVPNQFSDKVKLFSNRSF